MNKAETVIFYYTPKLFQMKGNTGVEYYISDCYMCHDQFLK